MQLVYNGVSASLTYIATASGFHKLTSGTSNVFDSANLAGANATKFAVLDLKDPSSSMTQNYPVITNGGEAVILVNVTAVFSGSGITQNSQVSGQVSPQVGSPGVIQFYAPFAYTQEVMQLQ